MHPLNDRAWQSDTRRHFFLFMDSQGAVNGTFYGEEFVFSSYGCDLHIDNELVANAFAALPKQEQSILILFCVLELGDGEIGDLMGMSRSAVQRHRAKTLNELRKKLKAHLPEGG